MIIKFNRKPSWFSRAYSTFSTTTYSAVENFNYTLNFGWRKIDINCLAKLRMKVLATGVILLKKQLLLFGTDSEIRR